MIPNLTTALRLGGIPRLAFVGAGGKTTALFHLAREYHSPVLVANTAHTELWQLALADLHLFYLDSGPLQLPPNLPGVTLLTGDRNNRSVAGVSPEGINHVLTYARQNQLPLLIEADGSRRHPVKAPADHEPPIPGFVETVVVTVGLTALGHELCSDWVHRPEIFAALSGAPLGSTISPEGILRVLSHPSGGLKNIPPGARRVVLLNQADTPELRAQAWEMVPHLLKDYAAVIVTALLNQQGIDSKENPFPRSDRSPEIFSVHEPVAGVILPSGASRRMSSPKLLFPWRGEPMIRHVVRTALEANLAPVLVIVDAYSEEIQAAVDGLAVQFIPNPHWEEGQSASIQAGIKALPRETGGAVFLLGDQPQIPAELVCALVDAHSQTREGIIAPLIAGQPGNPVLFDRGRFGDLLKLKGDAGLRQIMEQSAAHGVPWNDPILQLDLDTPEDTQRLLNEGL